MAWREAVKKPVARPTAPKPKFESKNDDWETDITYEVEKFDLFFVLFQTSWNSVESNE